MAVLLDRVPLGIIWGTRGINDKRCTANVISSCLYTRTGVASSSTGVRYQTRGAPTSPTNPVNIIDDDA